MARSRHHRSSRSHRDGDSTPFWADPSGVRPATFAFSAGILIVALLLGGGAGWLGDTFVQLLCLPLLVLAAVEWRQRCWLAGDWALLGLLVGVVLLGALQLAPLSPGLWASLPGRSQLLADMHAVGQTPGRYTLSLNPFATERALLGLLPVIALLFATRWMSERQLRVMLLVLFATTLFLVAFGVMQKSAPASDVVATVNETIARNNLVLNSLGDQGPSSAPVIPDSGFAVYSNRNHFATLLALSIPLAFAGALAAWNRRRKQGKPGLPALSVAYLLVLGGLLAGILETRSRAGFLLATAGLVVMLALLRGMGLKRKLVWGIVGAVVVAGTAAVLIAGSDTLTRFDQSAGVGLRWQVHATTLDAARHFGGLGSGLGTFVEAYQQVPPREGILPAYVNHAHGDYHELWLEAGWPGMLLVIGFLGWYGYASARVWLRSDSPAVYLPARAASIAIGVVLVHSYMEYPLRKSAILAAMGLLCGLLQAGAQRKLSAAAMSEIQPQVRDGALLPERRAEAP